jgi:hypothetical protein
MDTEELDPLDEEFDYAERQPDLTKVPEWAKEAYKPLEEGGYELGWQSIKDKFRQSREFKRRTKQNSRAADFVRSVLINRGSIALKSQRAVRHQVRSWHLADMPKSECKVSF